MRDLILQLSKSSIYSTKPERESRDKLVKLRTSDIAHKVYGAKLPALFASYQLYLKVTYFI
ncbi:hypothetical protein DMT34_31925 [Klebsiella variicola]|nr:hypothetical protein D0898_27130 [Klebsiella pneumoniae]PXI46375.1 hypothetical protein DMP51_29765 [Klebsiella pneumoniae]PXL91910.1 hypothetical protein DMT34_31925 [Klebsiella variicola]HBY4270327.1 hypothetical protein [Klebsiella pneumoniae]